MSVAAVSVANKTIRLPTNTANLTAFTVPQSTPRDQSTSSHCTFAMSRLYYLKKNVLINLDWSWRLGVYCRALDLKEQGKHLYFESRDSSIGCSYTPPPPRPRRSADYKK